MADRPDSVPATTIPTQPVDRSLPTGDESAQVPGLQVSAVAPTMASHATLDTRKTQATLASDSASVPARGSARRDTHGPAVTAQAELRGSLIGRFMILRKLGEGGMGVVYAAYDEELDRKVALKLLRASYQGGTAIARLIREAQGLARLSHPNVVQVHEFGQHQGSVFIAMEYVEGRTMREELAATPDRPWREILAMLLQAGRGLAAAHEKQLVHRDFKPDNVMIADDGRVRVLDFGLVRNLGPGALEDDDHDDESDGGDAQIARSPAARQLTRTGAIMGTPAYMALEQLEGRRADALTDQFAFCVVLFEALYGQRPFDGDTAAAVAARMYAGEIRPRPAKTEIPRRIHDAIIRGLAAEPRDRWPDMASLLAELERSLEQRKRLGLWLGLGALAGLVGLIVVATPLIRDALAERDRVIAEQQQHLEARARELEAANEQLTRRNAELQRQFDVQSGLASTLLADSPGRSLEALTRAIEVYGGYHLRGQQPPLEIEAGMFAATRRLHDSRELLGHRERVVALAFAPDGSRLATASRDDTAKLWDAGTGELLRSFEGHVDDLSSVAFSPEGDRLLTTSADASATIWLIDTGKVLATIDEHDVTVASFSPDGQALAVGAEDGSLSLWNAAPGEEIVEQAQLDAGGSVTALSFSPDGARLLTAAEGEQLRLWGLERDPGSHAAAELARFEGARVGPRTLAFSPDGSRVAVGGPDGSIVLRDARSGAAVDNLDAAHGELHVLAFSPVGLRLASAGREGPPKLWDASDGALRAELEGHREAATDLGFSPNGSVLATVSYDARLRLCDPDSGRVLETLEGQPTVLDRVAFSPDGKKIASLGNDRVLRLWAAGRSSEAPLVRARGRELQAAVFSADRQRVLMGERGGRASVWATTGEQAGQALLELDHGDATVYGVAFAPDGSRLATGDTAHLARIWDASSGELLHTLDGHQSDVRAIGFSPDSRLLASADLRGQLRLWSAQDGRLRREWKAADEGVTALAFSPDGSQLATSGLLGLVSVWAVETGERRQLLPIEGPLFALGFSPDGRRLAVAGQRKQVEIWELETPARVALLVGEDPAIDALAFSPDGRRLITGGDGWVRLWEVESGLHLADFAHHHATVLGAAFSPDGRRVLSASADAWVWETVATARERLELGCRALRGNRGYGVVSRTCAVVLESGP